MALNYQKHKSELTSPSQIKTKRGAFWKQFPIRALGHFSQGGSKEKPLVPVPVGLLAQRVAGRAARHSEGFIEVLGPEKGEVEQPCHSKHSRKKETAEPSHCSRNTLLPTPSTRGCSACACPTHTCWRKSGCQLVSACSSHPSQRYTIEFYGPMLCVHLLGRAAQLRASPCKLPL